MARKADRQHWYQVHKAKAGSTSVAESLAVREANAHVRDLEDEVSRYRRQVSETFGAGLRRLIFGLNGEERLLQQATRRLNEAKAAAAKAEAHARRQGEQAYRDDWVSRNPDKIGRP